MHSGVSLRGFPTNDGTDMLASDRHHRAPAVTAAGLVIMNEDGIPVRVSPQPPNPISVAFLRMSKQRSPIDCNDVKI